MVYCCYTRRIELDWLAASADAEFWADAEMRSGGAARGGSSFGWRGAAARCWRKKVLQEHLDNFIAAVFPRGSKKRKSNNDDKHDHGQEKRRLSTLCWGKKSLSLLYVYPVRHRQVHRGEQEVRFHQRGFLNCGVGGIRRSLYIRRGFPVSGVLDNPFRTPICF